MDEIIIKMSLDTQATDGYEFRIYDSDEAYMECRESVNGVWRGFLDEAIAEVFSHAQEVIRQRGLK